PLSVPANLGGPGVGTNPEALLLAAANGCYLITLSKLLHNRGIPFLRIEVTSEGRVEHDGGLRFDEIVHRPTVVVEHADDEARILVLAEHAEHACMVSSALRGNVKVRVEPQVRVQAAQV
ncbi:MAG: OsmC family protein, partial [Alicyclobacillus sp.]|nr:OsmC family protein [Alicyclobacillus sp.]